VTVGPKRAARPPHERDDDAAQMVERQLRRQGIADARVLAAMRAVPRHRFVPADQQDAAYDDRPLPIGFGQTISQPYIVAFMTEALALAPTDAVLEVGTGCGYQTAVLAPLVGRIYSIERIEPLLERAKDRLRELDIRNVRFKYGDGAEGWASQAPFDAILMAAAPHAIPQKLLDQLAEGGRLVAPVGPEGRQELLRFTRHKDQFLRERLGFVSFVPLLGGVT
jgi:protein-L-isoaspartate(D-aspartate) O-methyltransferase